MAQRSLQNGYTSAPRMAMTVFLAAVCCTLARAQSTAIAAVPAYGGQESLQQQVYPQQVDLQQLMQQNSYGAMPDVVSTAAFAGWSSPLRNSAVNNPQSIQAAVHSIFNQTNAFRKQHKAPPLSWNPMLAAAAAKWATHCTFEADPQNTAGESVFATAAGWDTAAAVKSAVYTWYNQGGLYDYRRPEFQLSTAAFTQMIWYSTTDMGCAAQTCLSGLKGAPELGPAVLVICRFSPIGNLYGEFEDNVLPLGGQPTQVPRKPGPQKAKPQAPMPPSSNLPLSGRPQLPKRPFQQQKKQQNQQGQKLGKADVPKTGQQQQQPAQVPAEAPASAGQQGASSDKTAQLQAAMRYVLNTHNQLRRNHLGNPLMWSDELASGAATQAAKCDMTEEPSETFGENMFASGDSDELQALYKAPQEWYSGVAKYNYSTPGLDPRTKHFTQVVWRTTTNLGCAVNSCDNGITGAAPGKRSLVVCRYSPAGNRGTASAYITNIKPGFMSRLQPTPSPYVNTADSPPEPTNTAAYASAPATTVTVENIIQPPPADLPAALAQQLAIQKAAAAAGAAASKPAGLADGAWQEYLAAAAAAAAVMSEEAAELDNGLQGAQTAAAADAAPRSATATATATQQHHRQQPSMAYAASINQQQQQQQQQQNPPSLQAAPAASVAAGQTGPAVYVLVRLPAATAAAAGIAADYAGQVMLPAVA